MEYTHAETDRWRIRTERRLLRLQQRERARRRITGSTEDSSPADIERERIRAEIQAAVKRVKARKARLSGRVS
jgi:hypothetical protein